MSEIVMVKERPILMSAPMALATLCGDKTQTRRVMKPQPVFHPEVKDVWTGVTIDSYWTWRRSESHNIVLNGNAPYQPNILEWCPYGKVGDRLWVREAFTIVPRTAYRLSEGVQQTLKPDCDHDAAIYKAGWVRSTHGWHWKPSIFMPRWASRILLEITGVRVEWVQDISESDAKAEGVVVWHGGVNGTTYRPEFQMLWDSINAKREGGVYSWARNPFVWVVEFKRITAAETEQENGNP